jgi:glutaredoxin
MATPVEVKIYSRADCHLCEDAKATIERVADEVDTAVTIEEIDVDTDETLRAEYGDRVPYVFVDGWPAFKYEVDTEELRRQLQDAA